MLRASHWMPSASLPPAPKTTMSKIARMTSSPISAVPSTFTDSSTSNQQSTLISSAAKTANITHGSSQPNHALKFVTAKYEKPPRSEPSNSVYASAPQMPVASPSSRPRPCEMSV